MTMSSGLYVPAFRDALDTTGLAVDFLSASNIVCLYTDTKTPVHLTDAAHSTTNELATGTGYTQDTKTVGGTPTFAGTGTGATTALTYSWSASVSWTSATFAAYGMIIGKASTLEPLVSVTFGALYTATAGTFSITAHANGIYAIDMVP